MSDWEQADAVERALWDRWPHGMLESDAWRDQANVAFHTLNEVCTILYGFGPTYVAALIDLGTELDEDGAQTRQDRSGRTKEGAHEE